MKKVFLITIASLIFWGCGGFGVLENETVKEKLEPSVLKEDLEISANPNISGWKLFKNEEFGIKFSYPPTHSVHIENREEVVISDDRPECRDIGCYFLSVKKIEDEEEIKQKWKIESHGILPEDADYLIEVAGVPAKRAPPGQGDNTGLFFEHSSREFGIDFFIAFDGETVEKIIQSIEIIK